jgi:hypothetical protein
MNVTRQVKEELDTLSKDVFGTSSRWQKLIGKGYSELVTEEVEEKVPAEKEGDEPTTRKVRVPVKNKHGMHQSAVVRHTVESVREFMLQRKEQLDRIRAAIKAQQEEAQAKKEQEQLAAKVHEELQGSAL